MDAARFGSMDFGDPNFGGIGFKKLLRTLHGINISHLAKRKIIFKMPFWGNMLVPWRAPSLKLTYVRPLKRMVSNLGISELPEFSPIFQLL